MPAHQGPPDFTSPPGGCDAHFHVFGPAQRYPYGGELRYAPPLAPLADFVGLARKLGLSRYVFVQPSAYGRDNRCMLDAMREAGPRSCRGIVDIDENAPDAEIGRLDALGVRGVRINLSPVRPFESGFAPKLMPRIARLAARCAEAGWHLDFLTPGWLTEELMPTLRRLRLDYTLAHFGMFQAKQGVDQPGFRQLLELLRSGERRCWVKLTGAYRISAAAGFADVAPMAHALIEAAPDRLIWGSDYPHLSFADKVGSVDLWNLLGSWAPDEATRRRILVDNPGRLFGFP
ncbi:MAG TPA: amidohydrolase family protein [Burkholderiales bacterium]|nr:amidohydrolase family protein [Burkholderiales bacterium]